jgi:hypothetical protein
LGRAGGDDGLPPIESTRLAPIKGSNGSSRKPNRKNEKTNTGVQSNTHMEIPSHRHAAASCDGRSEELAEFETARRSVDSLRLGKATTFDANCGPRFCAREANLEKDSEAFSVLHMVQTSFEFMPVGCADDGSTQVANTPRAARLPLFDIGGTDLPPFRARLQHGTLELFFGPRCGSCRGDLNGRQRHDANRWLTRRRLLRPLAHRWRSGVRSRREGRASAGPFQRILLERNDQRHHGETGEETGNCNDWLSHSDLPFLTPVNW